MKSIFFITGYPRSRTAWLATLLTWGDCFCFHDGLANIESFDELDKKFDEVPGDIVGNSDPANLLFYEPLKKRYPDAKWILIERDVYDARISSRKTFGSMASAIDWSDLARRMGAFKKDWPCVSFENLNLSWAIDDILDYIGIQIPKHRVRELMRLNVQVQPELFRSITSEAVEKMQKLKASFTNECVLA